MYLGADIEALTGVFVDGKTASPSIIASVTLSRIADLYPEAYSKVAPSVKKFEHQRLHAEWFYQLEDNTLKIADCSLI